MGCPWSQLDPNTGVMPDKVKLERQMYLSRENPDEEYSLTECNIKDIPTAVFVTIRVLRKRKLDLSRNRLSSLRSGGSLEDLNLLTHLNLSHNSFKRLPEDLCTCLPNLRELLVTHNQLVALPQELARLQNLETLDVSHNQLKTADQIAHLARLRTLNLGGNQHLTSLPTLLGTCRSLENLVLDGTPIEVPPDLLSLIREAEPQTREEPDSRMEMEDKNLALLAQMEEENDLKLNLEAFQKDQVRQRQELLRLMQDDQEKTEAMILEVQELKEWDRRRVVAKIREEEEESLKVFEQLSSLRAEPDPSFLEQEKQTWSALLETREVELRRQEVINQMKATLDDEMERFRAFSSDRDTTLSLILEQERQSIEELRKFFEINDSTRRANLAKVASDEELQKVAVMALLTNQDARTWALVQQVRILGVELSKLTHLELDKKKVSLNEQFNDLAMRRVEIASLLEQLMGQQEDRKRELCQNILKLQEETASQDIDFWLVQYQRLLDQQPAEISNSFIDPELGLAFLKAGVLNLLPFLAYLLHYSAIPLHQITDEQLKEVGIRQETDRAKILEAIRGLRDGEVAGPSVPSPQESLRSECVVCMDAEPEVLFIPCGHLCCCSDCQSTLEECPMCRSAIERRIKMIRP